MASLHDVAAQESGGLVGGGPGEEVFRGRLLDQAAADEDQDVAGQVAHLAEVVVAITILIPDAAASPMIASTALLAAGSRLLVGSTLRR